MLVVEKTDVALGAQANGGGSGAAATAAFLPVAPRALSPEVDHGAGCLVLPQSTQEGGHVEGRDTGG